jgi:cytochrome P450
MTANPESISISPPGPPWHNMWEAIRSSPHTYMLKLAEKYGDIVKFQGAFPVYGISDPESVRQILTRAWPDFTKETIDYRVIATVFGNGLVTNDGESWAQQRKLMQPVFSSKSINGFDSIITDVTDNVLNNWMQCENSEIWLDREMSRITFQIVSRTLFGADIDEISDEMIDILMLLNIHPLRLDALLRLFPHIPAPSNRRFKAANRRLDEIVYGLIKSHRESTNDSDDIVDRLLKAVNPETGAGMDEKQIRDEVVTLMLAGHETSSTGLTWTFYLLSKHPEIEKRLLEEIRTVLQGRTPNSSDLSQLPYLKQVVQESMRLYPPVWGIARRSKSLNNFQGYTVPPNSYIAITPYVLHRNPEHWVNPNLFDPDRFSPGKSKSRHPYAYLPFGAGPRACIGAGMAMLEMQLIIAQILPLFKLTPTKDHPVEMEAAVTLKPRFGMKVKLSRR